MKRHANRFLKGLIEGIIGTIFLLFVVLGMLWINGECNQKYYAAEKTEVTEKWTELGTYKITHFDNCVKCCGKTDGITASGTKCTRYRTVAMNGIPFGTTIYIEGYGYRVVEDRGGGLSDKQVDVYTPDHKHALEMGIKYRRVWIVTKGDK